MHNVKEMIAIVQMYIHHRKGVEVNISIRNTKDMFLLVKAYDIAQQWRAENNFRMIN